MKKYSETINSMTKEELATEFCSAIGDELCEFDWMLFHFGREYVEEILLEWNDINEYAQGDCVGSHTEDPTSSSVLPSGQNGENT
jgi:hypothetical protein